MQRLNSFRFSKLDIIVIGIVIFVGAIHIPYPLGDDQALFLMGAQKMSQGAVLYRDFWDVKQPGIYLFYLVGVYFFGFSEVGPHVLDVMYMAALSIVLIYTLRNYFDKRWAVSLVPLLSVGFYYAAPGREHYTGIFTQVEGLVGFPLYLVLWFAYKSLQRPERCALWIFLSGIAGGIVLVLKLMFLPLLLAIWFMTLLFTAIHHQTAWPRVLLRCCAPLTLGVLLPLLIIAMYFAQSGNLGLLAYTSFVYPITAAGDTEFWKRISQLFVGFQWFLGWSAALLALGLLGAWESLRRARDFITLNLVIWIIVGLLLIFIQVLSWWAYHYLLVLVPLGILAAKGLEFLQRQLAVFVDRKHRFVLLASLVLLFSPVVDCWIIDTLILFRYKLAWNKEDRVRFHAKIDPRYAQLREDGAFLLEPASLRGDIFVLGPYVYYPLVGRNQAIALNGESPEQLTPAQWKQINEQLTKALPPYIFIANDVAILPGITDSGLTRLLEASYRVHRTTDSGVWYVLRQ